MGNMFSMYFSVTECWTGFTGNMANFCFFVVDKYIIKIEAWITELSGSPRHVAIKTVAKTLDTKVSCCCWASLRPCA